MSFWVCACECRYLTVSPNANDEFFTQLVLVSSLVFFSPYAQGVTETHAKQFGDQAGEGGMLWFKANLSKDFAMMDVSVISEHLVLQLVGAVSEHSSYVLRICPSCGCMVSM